MKIAVIHDYADALRKTRAYDKLKGHDVVVHTDAYTDPNRVVEQVAELGGDPAKIAIAGDSAGGNLAAVVAQVLRDEGTQLAAQLLLYPAVDFTDGDGYASREQNAAGYLLTATDMVWFTEQYLAADSDPKDPRLSPLYGNLADLPPAVVATAEFDPLRDEVLDHILAVHRASLPELGARLLDDFIRREFEVIDQHGEYLLLWRRGVPRPQPRPRDGQARR